MNKRKILIALSSVFLLAFLSTTMVVAPTVVGTLYSCPADPIPVIDGVLGVSEWKEGVPLTVKLYNLVAQADTKEIEIMSLYDNDNRIYFGITYQDDRINAEDYIFLIFQDVEGTDICYAPHSVDGGFNDGHDMKFMWLYNNLTMDAFTKGPGYNWADDVSNGGINHGVGKCHENGTHVTVEIRFPMNTGDTAGFDVSLAVNGSVNMFIGYHDEDTHVDYYQVREADNNYDLIRLQVSCTATTPVSIAYIILGLMITLTTSILIKKKRK